MVLTSNIFRAFISDSDGLPQQVSKCGLLSDAEHIEVDVNKILKFQTPPLTPFQLSKGPFGNDV